MNKNWTMIPINLGLMALKMISVAAAYLSSWIIYIAGGITLIVIVSCLFFGLASADGVWLIIKGSVALLLMLALIMMGAKAAEYLLQKLQQKHGRG